MPAATASVARSLTLNSRLIQGHWQPWADILIANTRVGGKVVFQQLICEMMLNALRQVIVQCMYAFSTLHRP